MAGWGNSHIWRRAYRITLTSTLLRGMIKWLSVFYYARACLSRLWSEIPGNRLAGIWRFFRCFYFWKRRAAVGIDGIASTSVIGGWYFYFRGKYILEEGGKHGSINRRKTAGTVFGLDGKYGEFRFPRYKQRGMLPGAG